MCMCAARCALTAVGFLRSKKKKQATTQTRNSVDPRQRTNNPRLRSRKRERALLPLPPPHPGRLLPVLFVISSLSFHPETQEPRMLRAIARRPVVAAAALRNSSQVVSVCVCVCALLA